MRRVLWWAAGLACHGFGPTRLVNASQAAFKPFAAQGNTIHVTTADFDGVGARDFVVAATVDGTVTAYARIADIVDPGADNRLWSYMSGVFGFMLGTVKLQKKASTADHILLPGVDGHLRVLNAKGNLTLDLRVGVGATYCADAGFTSAGSARIVAGGVDGRVYVFDGTGTVVGSVKPWIKGNQTSLVRRVVVGNFDGAGGDEVVVFFNTGGFTGGGHFIVYDLDTLQIASYWNATRSATDDVVTGLGWTDKQLPMAYDINLDGKDELVAHWGVLHPSAGRGTGLLSTMVAFGERLNREKQYDDVHPFTLTNKYIMQKAVAGRFRSGDFPGVITVYGDDLYHLRYTAGKPKKDKGPTLRVDDYTYRYPDTQAEPL